MSILITNDDGIDAKGINVLARYLSRDFEINVLAPKTNQSGSSNSITLNRRLIVERHSENIWSLDGTPTDCVRLVYSGFFNGIKPTTIVSGINRGENIGDDCIYSGTLAAAQEGRFIGGTNLALSLMGNSPDNYDSVALFTLELLNFMQACESPRGAVLSINFPDVPIDRYRFVGLANPIVRNGVKRIETPVYIEVGETAAVKLPVPEYVNEADEETDLGLIQKNGVSLSFFRTGYTLDNSSLFANNVVDHMNSYLNDISINRSELDDTKIFSR